jgi:hypothetical protein
MNTLMLIYHTLALVCLTIFQLAKQVCLIPVALLNTVHQGRQQTVLNEDEAERLDRLRNPSKYLGK